MLSISTIRYPRWIGIKHKINVTLAEDLFLEQWVVPKGTTVITFQTKDFGWVIVPKGVMPTGIKRIFKY